MFCHLQAETIAREIGSFSTAGGSGAGDLSVPAILGYFQQQMAILSVIPVPAIAPVPSPPAAFARTSPSVRASSPSLVRPSSAQKRTGTHSFGLSPSRSVEGYNPMEKEKVSVRAGAWGPGEGEEIPSRPMSAESRESRSGPRGESGSLSSSSKRDIRNTLGGRAGTGTGTDPNASSGGASPSRVTLEVPQAVTPHTHPHTHLHLLVTPTLTLTLRRLNDCSHPHTFPCSSSHKSSRIPSPYHYLHHRNNKRETSILAGQGRGRCQLHRPLSHRQIRYPQQVNVVLNFTLK